LRIGKIFQQNIPQTIVLNENFAENVLIFPYSAVAQSIFRNFCGNDSSLIGDKYSI